MNRGRLMRRVFCRLSQLLGVLLILLVALRPEPASAQWPPFEFSMIPVFDEVATITYQIKISNRAQYLKNFIIKIPIPEGTRFVEASAPPVTSVGFDGAEVSFVTVDFDRSLDNLFLVVEIIDPARTVFTARPWISWQGDQPGEYLVKDVNLDVTRAPLDWPGPPDPALQLQLGAVAANGQITYLIYAQNLGGRMWDIKINVPLPEGTSFLSAEALSPFVANFDGREVSFSLAELERRRLIGPLKFTVSAEGAATPVVTTHAWATWKNTGRKVGREEVLQEEFTTGNIIVQPQAAQQVVADMIGDVPFRNYDLTSVALQDDQGGLGLTLYMAEPINMVDQPLEYNFYIDADCTRKTGRQLYAIGAEYQVRFHEQWTDLNSWNEQAKSWEKVLRLRRNSQITGNMATTWVPYAQLNRVERLCWVADIEPKSKAYRSRLPADVFPDGRDPQFSQYAPSSAALTATPPAEMPVEEDPETKAAVPTTPTSGKFIRPDDPWQYLPAWSEPPPAWKSIDFDDGDWFFGRAGMGYGGQEKLATDLSDVTQPFQANAPLALVEQTDAQSGITMAMVPVADFGSLFMRQIFTATNVAALTRLTLDVAYEDGFVAYLNGVEVARRGLGEPGEMVYYTTYAEQDREVIEESIDISPYMPRLVSGANVLAIQAHRAEIGSSLFVAPRLNWGSRPEAAPAPETEAPPEAETETAAVPGPGMADPSSVPSIADISGKLAVPLDNSWGLYDVVIFSVPSGQEIARITNARQPSFRFDGQRLLINREGGGMENLYEYDLATGTDKAVSDAPRDAHPTYDPWGNRVAYGNTELAVGSPEPLRDGQGNIVIDGDGDVVHTDGRKPFIFVQCGLQPPHQETEPRCRDIPGLGVLVPAGHMGEIQGTHPVWTSNDMIAYKGCNTWAGSRLCGIYVVPSASTKGFSDGFIPRQITTDSSDVPSDSKGNLVAFTSRRDGDWEAYLTDLTGAEVKNLSNSPGSNDGLPTISPDGNWAAFVSDRDGVWAIWAVPLAGGPAEKLFDLPVSTPWGDGDRTWLNERLSWGP